EVLLEDVRDERPGGRGHLPLSLRLQPLQLIATEPPLIRFTRRACETRSFPLIRILPSARIVIEPSPHRSVSPLRASTTSSSGTPAAATPSAAGRAAATADGAPTAPSTTPRCPG